MSKISILKSGSLCTKSFSQGADGEYVSSSSTLGRLFDHDYYSLQSFSALASCLSLLEDDAYSCVIRGALIEPTNNQQIRRTSRTRSGDGPNFEAALCRWCMVDIDDVNLPEHLTDYQVNKEQVVAYAVSLLPEQFHRVQCWYQFSASMGIKKDKVRLHLWYWLSRPCSDEEMKGWFQDSPVDLALFNPVQPHFTARPIFSDGAIDPLPDRSGIYSPSVNDTVPVPELLPLVKKASQRRAALNRFGFLDSQEVIRDPETNLIIDGRERFLLVCSNEAMSQLLRGNKTTPELVPVTDLTWQLFTAETDLKDGKYTKENAANEASRRIGEFESGDYDFVGKVENTVLLPAPDSYFKLNPLSVKDGMALLNDELENFFSNLEAAPKKVLRITMGAGKTQQTVERLREHLAKKGNQSIEIYVPRHDLAKEYDERLKDVNAEVIHVRPRISRDSDSASLCRRSTYVNSLEKLGASVFQNACRSAEGDRCEYWADCPYIIQFFPTEIGASVTNQIRIYVHNYLGLTRNPLMEEPHLVIIDESFFNSMIQITDIKLNDVRTYLTSERHPKLGGLVITTLFSGEPLLKTLRDSGVRLTHLDEIELASPVGGFDASINTPMRSRSNVPPAALFGLIQQLQNELRIHERDHPVSILLHTDKDGHDYVRVCRRSELDLSEDVPVLMLDATADKQLIKGFFDTEVDLKRIDIQQRAYVTQVYDRTGSNQFWQSKSAPTERLVRVLNAWAEFGEKPLCVGSKALIKTLEARDDLHPQVLLMNFVALRGSNAASDCSVIFITGRNEPPPIDVDHRARALFWADLEPLGHEDFSPNQNLPLEMRGFLSSDKNPQKKAGVFTRTFSDPRVEAVHQQIREAESVQAIARLRLVHSERSKRVYILSNVPLEIPVDEFLKMDDLMPDQLEHELLKTGNIPLTPLGLVTMRPDLAGSTDAARKKLKRSKLKDSSLLASLPSLKRHGLVKLEFTAKNNGRRRKHEHLFLLQDKLVTDEQGRSVQATVTNLPTKQWIKHLESGWLNIEQPRVEFY